jgi:hypothetical protein
LLWKPNHQELFQASLLINAWPINASMLRNMASSKLLGKFDGHDAWRIMRRECMYAQLLRCRVLFVTGIMQGF